MQQSKPKLKFNKAIQTNLNDDPPYFYLIKEKRENSEVHPIERGRQFCIMEKKPNEKNYGNTTDTVPICILRHV